MIFKIKKCKYEEETPQTDKKKTQTKKKKKTCIKQESLPVEMSPGPLLFLCVCHPEYFPCHRLQPLRSVLSYPGRYQYLASCFLNQWLKYQFYYQHA